MSLADPELSGQDGVRIGGFADFRHIFASQSCSSPSSEILCSGDGFEMVGVHAQTNTAEMVNVHSSGNWTDVSLIGESVSESASGELSVSGAPYGSVPNPTISLIAHLLLVPEMRAKLLSGLGSRPMSLAEAFAYSDLVAASTLAAHMRSLPDG